MQRGQWKLLIEGSDLSTVIKDHLAGGAARMSTLRTECPRHCNAFVR
jgi:hypothetical protein